MNVALASDPTVLATVDRVCALLSGNAGLSLEELRIAARAWMAAEDETSVHDGTAELEGEPTPGAGPHWRWRP